MDRFERPDHDQGVPQPSAARVPPSVVPSVSESTGESAALDPLEQQILRRAQSGDADAFEALVRRHQQRAFRIARHMVPSDEDARDLVQEAFLRVFRSLERFDFQFSFATWLHRIVTNLAIDHLRKRRLLTSTGNAGDDDDGIEMEVPDLAQPQPSQRLESNETAQRVRECIAALAPHFQAVLTLRELDGLPCTEIARLVGATHVTVRWRLHRGRKLFQEEWERRERAEHSGAERHPATGFDDDTNARSNSDVDQDERRHDKP